MKILIIAMLCLALTHAQDDATCSASLNTIRTCMVTAAGGIATSQNVNLEGFKTCAKAASCSSMPHIDPDQMHQCVLQSSLGTKMNATKACMRAAFPNFQPPDMKAEMQQAGAKLLVASMILKCFDCDAVKACAAPNNIDVNGVQTSLDAARATCNANKQSIQATCNATFTKIKQTGCQCFQTSFPSADSIPVAEIAPCMQLTVPAFAYPMIAQKIYGDLQSKLCGDELTNGSGPANGQCPPKMPPMMG